MSKSSRIKRVVMVAPRSTGGNFEYVAIPRQGLLFISGALKQWDGSFRYDREIWYEDRNGTVDANKDLEDVDILMVTALINEAPRAYEITREAKQYHPELPIVGGGPHMSPLAEEALRYGQVDVVVIREGEDVIGELSDVLLTYRGSNLAPQLRKIPGIAFLEDGNYVETRRHGILRPDYVELPDFPAMRDLTPMNPLAAGVVETVRGCTESCTYCQVIQQFLGYRMIPREVELKRLAQLQKLAEDGLIYTSRNGRFSVFVSDDLHPPPLRAVKFRNERLERLKGWKGHTEGMWMICQTRAEIGQDPELAYAMRDVGIEMIYAGVESSSAENLLAVNKRQDPGQMHKDLVALNEMGFVVTAMTIIGLPFDSEQSIMDMADWIKTVSRYQTANLLTPLPATSNWDTLPPLDEDGSPLPAGKMRPYQLYTGRQLVHQDERWTMQESRDLFARYTSRLRPVDRMYERIFRMFRSKGYGQTPERLPQEPSVVLNAGGVQTLADPRIGLLVENVQSAIRQTKEAITSSLSDLAASVSGKPGQTEGTSATDWRSSVADRVRELQESMSVKLEEMGDTLSARTAELRTGLSSTTGELRDSLSAKLDELGESFSAKVAEMRTSASALVGELRESFGTKVDEVGESLSTRLGEMGALVSVKTSELGDAISLTINDLKSLAEYASGPVPSRGSTPA